jgi:hypothetical protein
MESLKKPIVLSIGMLLVLMHFAFIWLYMLKPNTASFLYVYPFFHQDWQLFAPPPKANYFLYLRGPGGKVTDVFSEVSSSHQKNRLSGHEAFVLAFSNSIYHFEANALAAGFNSGNAGGNSDFAIVETMTRNYLTQKAGPLAEGKLVLCIIDIQTKEQRVYFN